MTARKPPDPDGSTAAQSLSTGDGAGRFWMKRLAAILLCVAVPTFLEPLLAGGWFPPFWYQLLHVMGINVALAVSLNLINGFAGQFSIGHAGFMAVGAYSSAYFTLHAFTTPVAGMPAMIRLMWMTAALGVGALAAGTAGIFVGVPTLRLRGDYLAIMTLGFGEIIRVFILNIEAVGGASGLPDIPGLAGFAVIWIVAIGAIAVSRNLLVTSHGRAVLAIREDEIAAEALGVPTILYRVRVFALSASIAGMAGCLSAHYDMYLTPDSFTFLRSIEIILMIILGGLGSTTGAVVGAAIVTLLPEGLRYLPPIVVGTTQVNVQDWRMVLYSLLIIVLMLTRPKGLLGGVELSWHGMSRIAGRHKIEEAEAGSSSPSEGEQGSFL